ncbi:DUF423 domain-containing protein [Puniceicoccales bacterium CK1056]|uniref:DUF423 domain-containing protein n=1 Tax=Oceanipulchritudo coccoides TaxID=2706888 RepID=A0A6B2M5Q7_9BACT|nr:DUF423 domain-containing protein [Oceanipulchritudo coccoides]NDV63477.1 DUF423 domain-containing protein [Oceanipulchritudo coccoides]
MDKQLALRITALTGALGIALGAFGAHGLESHLLESGRLETWKTAAFYHLLHVVVMLVLVLRTDWRPLPWLGFFSGVCIFSGSLYLLSLTQIGWLGAITPIGGVLLIAGWVSLAFTKQSAS